ncbi:GNAT family N-acetyltransferase [Cognatishimia sp.]|uniref:GNAT family N-acetyltransferase n=1 Tax=Cognatishimia sp. TaxID=2211648 RepID=UPI003511CAC3|nr:GNAT family N-acetyltransferase [Cognatishimia sp.]
MTQELIFHVLTEETAHFLEGADVFDNPVDHDQRATFIADPGHMMVFATLAERMVGMASGTVLLHPDKPPALFVNEVGVDEALRNQGIGTALTQRLLDMGRARGCEGIWLATEGDNAPARALYRKLGARETKEIVVYDWDGAMDD